MPSGDRFEAGLLFVCHLRLWPSSVVRSEPVVADPTSIPWKIFEGIKRIEVVNGISVIEAGSASLRFTAILRRLSSFWRCARQKATHPHFGQK
jgi:hypothetical protein